MIPLGVHPDTGLRYVYVVYDTWGPYVDIRACSEMVERRNQIWFGVISRDEFEILKETPAYQDSSTFFILWGNFSPGVKEKRKSLVASVFFEAIGEPDTMLPDHVRDLNLVNSVSREYDAIFAHTPRMAAEMGMRTGLHSYVLPVGWDPEAMGRPRFSTPKNRDLVFYGSVTGKRTLLLPFFKQQLGNRLTDLSGNFGRQLCAELDNSKGSFYLSHSDVWSMSTWRIWQTIASSAALVAEPADSWPLMDEHYYKLPRITFQNYEAVSDDLKRIIDQVDLLSISKKAHQDLGPEYTFDKCVEKYLIPASMDLLTKRA